MDQRARINAYLDCNSPYSYYAMIWLKRNRPILAEHGVDIEFHPIFLGGINVGSGNKPPWTLPAKSKLGAKDRVRAQEYFDTPPMEPPSFFPIMTLLPLRCMLYIKDTFDQERFEAQFEQLWVSYWQKSKDISKMDEMKACLSANFNEEEIAKIIEGGTSAKYKQMLLDEVKIIVDKGAYGAPWILVTDKEGKTEAFFGSDRFPFICRYLNVPYSDFRILHKNESKL